MFPDRGQFQQKINIFLLKKKVTFTPATKEKKIKLIRKLKFGSLNLFLYLKLVYITKFALLGMKGLSLLLGMEVYLFHLMCINVCQHVVCTPHMCLLPLEARRWHQTT